MPTTFSSRNRGYAFNRARLRNAATRGGAYGSAASLARAAARNPSVRKAAGHIIRSLFTKYKYKGYPRSKTRTTRGGRAYPPRRSTGRRAVQTHTALSHRALQNHYNFNKLGYCVTEDLAIYNSNRFNVSAIPSLLNYSKYGDSFCITNNGIMPGTGVSGPLNFVDNDLSYYINLDFGHALGKYQGVATVDPDRASASNQIYSLRNHYKRWRKSHLKFTIKWSTQVDNLHPLDIPEGYYQVVTPENVKTMLDSLGAILTDVATDNQIARTETQLLSPPQVLKRKYGTPIPYTNTTTVAGNFPSTAVMPPSGGPVAQEFFTYENVSRNPKGWTKIPRSRTMEINVPYGKQSSFTTKNNAFTDPLIFFIFNEIPPSWLTQQTKTDANITNNAVGTNNTSRATTEPQFSDEQIVAKIADMKVLHCYEFTQRAEHLVATSVPAYPSQEALIPY